MDERNRRLRGLLVVALLLSMLVGPAALRDATASVHRSEAAATARGTISLSPSIAGPGDVVRVRSKVPGGVRRPVVLQRARGDGWVVLASKRSTRAGRARFRTDLPSRTGPRTYRYRVVAARVRDQGLAKVVTRARKVTVPAPPEVATTSLPDAVAGEDYAVTLVAGTPAPGTWSAGWLPAGLGLSSGGVLSGRPTVAGVFAFSVTLTDDHGQSASRVLTLSVLAARWLTLDRSRLETCGVKLGGSAWCWGSGATGSLADGSSGPRVTPMRLPGDGWVQVDTSGSAACGVKRDGSGWCWQMDAGSPPSAGAEAAGSFPVGSGRPSRWSMPSRSTPPLAGSGSAALPGAGAGTCTDRSVAEPPSRTSWTPLASRGDGPRSRSGTGPPAGCRWTAPGGAGDRTRTASWVTAPSPIVPRPCECPVRGPPSRLVSCRRVGREELSYPPTTTCGVRTDGTGWCWGANAHGQVGDGTTDDRELAPPAWLRLVVTEQPAAHHVRGEGQRVRVVLGLQRPRTDRDRWDRDRAGSDDVGSWLVELDRAWLHVVRGGRRRHRMVLGSE